MFLSEFLALSDKIVKTEAATRDRIDLVWSAVLGLARNPSPSDKDELEEEYKIFLSQLREAENTWRDTFTVAELDQLKEINFENEFNTDYAQKIERLHDLSPPLAELENRYEAMKQAIWLRSQQIERLEEVTKSLRFVYKPTGRFDRIDMAHVRHLFDKVVEAEQRVGLSRALQALSLSMKRFGERFDVKDFEKSGAMDAYKQHLHQVRSSADRLHPYFTPQEYELLKELSGEVAFGPDVRNRVERALDPSYGPYHIHQAIEFLQEDRNKGLLIFATDVSSDLRDLFNPLSSKTTKPENEDKSDQSEGIPSQTGGLYFALRADGALAIAPASALDTAGNNVALLKTLHPLLLEAAAELVTGLSRGNAPYTALLDRARAYDETLNKPLEQISFTLAFVNGLRLGNALSATQQDIARDELPTFDAALEEKISSVLALHSSFIANTADGLALLAAEQRYQRRPSEERLYRESATEFAKTLAGHPEIMDPSASAAILNAAKEMGTGLFPERSAVAADMLVSNSIKSIVTLAAIVAAGPAVAIVSVPAGIFVGATAALVMSKGFEKSNAGNAAIERTRQSINQLFTVALPPLTSLAPHLDFVKSKIAILQRLENVAGYVPWLKKTLDLLNKDSVDNSK